MSNSDRICEILAGIYAFFTCLLGVLSLTGFEQFMFPFVLLILVGLSLLVFSLIFVVIRDCIEVLVEMFRGH